MDSHPKTVSFGPLAVEFAKRIAAPSKEACDILTDDFASAKGTKSFYSDRVRVMSLAIGPGIALENALCEISSSALQLLDTTHSPTRCPEVDLYEWAKALVTQVSTNAIYGSEMNPFKDPSVASSLWTIERNLAQLGSTRFPSILCPKGHDARMRFVAAFRKYYAAKGHKSASRLIQARFDLQESCNMAEEDVAHCDINVCLGLLINTVPATFWALYHVYSQPSLLEELREAISVHVQGSADGLTRHINIAAVAARCPLLDSVVQETLRVHAVGNSPRIVIEDTVLKNEYLLKKGSLVLVPSGELHRTSSFWGSAAKDFDAYRFCTEETFANKKPAPSSVFRAWGGGTFMCPGRFLAKNEIIILLVMMILKYDMEPLNGKPWPPPSYQWTLTAAILVPKQDTRVSVRERKGYASTCWTFEWNKQAIKSEL